MSDQMIRARLVLINDRLIELLKWAVEKPNQTAQCNWRRSRRLLLLS